MAYDTPVKFTETNQYGSGPDDEDDVYTIDEFLAHVASGAFVDYDGSGYPVKDKLADRNILVRPSSMRNIPLDATHIVWYNR